MFITFEGIDFCGKSTQIDLLEKHLLNKNKKVLVIREPGGTEISEKIRRMLLDKENSKMFMETEFLLFSASRSQLVREKIQPYLERGFYVISDRFHDSSSAYQGYGRGISIDVISSINKLAIGKSMPDITFLLIFLLMWQNKEGSKGVISIFRVCIGGVLRVRPLFFI